MADATASRFRLRRTSTWGNPSIGQTPRFVRLFGAILRRLNQILIGGILVLLGLIVGLLIYLVFGVTYEHLLATDGSTYSCEVQYVPGNKQ